jgi:decaprenyl-phosphate phosphoribosyltransferase
VTAHLPTSQTAPATTAPVAPAPVTALPAPAPPEARPAPGGRLGAARRWLGAVIRTARPRQWPKNLLVLAAPLAGASLGRDDGLSYALVAVAAFTAASSAVYFVNDVADADRDRRHPVKRNRPVAAGTLPAAQALAVAAVAASLAIAAGFWIGAPWLTVTIAAYLALSFLYSVVLKHVPGLELACVASGFVLRMLGGAAATHVPPSGWFLTVCSLGALMVAVAKRRGELARLGPEAARHRPVMRWYTYRVMCVLARAVAAGIIGAYLLWALSSGDGTQQLWHLVSIVPLAVALARFDWLSIRRSDRPVEDLIVADRVMAGAELAWLATFALGL